MIARKFVSSLIIGTSLSLSSLAGASSASAQEGHVITGAVDSEVSGGKIDTFHPISLTVKKTGHNPYDDSQSGSAHAAGVKFSLFRVKGVDVTDDATREKVMNTYSYEYIKENNIPYSKVQDGITDEKGFVSFTDLNPGLYILSQQGEKSTPDVIMLPMMDADGKSFHYDNLIVTKNFGNTPPKTPPETSFNPPSETPHESTPVEDKPSQIPPDTSSYTTPPPSSSATPPPPVDNQTPVFPGGPTVNTGGMAIPSLSGQGNMSIATMIAFLAAISGVGYMVYRFLSSRIKEEE